MPQSGRTSTSPEETDPPARSADSTRLGFREAMRLAHHQAARAYLERLLQDVGGEVARAARLAGIERESLHRLLRRHGVNAADFRSSSRNEGE